MIVAGLDIGNQTTELVVAEIERNEVRWLDLLLAPTGATKGTARSVEAAVRLLHAATPSPDLVVLPELAPVLTSAATVRVAETAGGSLLALRSTGRTAGPAGYASGRLVPLAWLERPSIDIPQPWLVVVPDEAEFDRAAALIGRRLLDGRAICGVACVGDDAVVIGSRLPVSLPIVDEVQGVEDLPPGIRAAIEVAPPGRTVQRLGDPLALAGEFGGEDLTAVALAVAGSRSAMVVELARLADATRPPLLDLQLDDGTTRQVDVFGLVEALTDDLPPARFASISSADPRLARLLAALPPRPSDLFATELPPSVEDWDGTGGRTISLGLAALSGVPADDLPSILGAAFAGRVQVVGREADAAAHGAATTPGAAGPTAVCDIGAGTIDLALPGGHTTTVAGAGDLVTLGLAVWAELPLATAELAKRHPVVAVLRPRLVLDEHGTRRWLDRDAPAGAVGGLAVDAPGGLVIIPGRGLTIERLVETRRRIKERVIGRNLARCLRAWPSPPGSVLLAGGGALDSELLDAVRAVVPPDVLLARANIAGRFGPRGAVAAGAIELWRASGGAAAG